MKSPNERESEILKYWQDNNIFQKSLDKNKDQESFRYYDGPPYATGLPHFGNALPSAIKDMYPRYKTMRGYNVPRSWGWDTHGLPIESLAEKTLGFKGKKDIEEFGIGPFNETARASVFKFREDWKKIIPRIGRWADMDNDYRTLDASFMESNLWAFKELYNKGLVYEGYKVMPWCPHCETVLSNYEVTEGYKDIADLSAYVYFNILDGEYKDTSIIAWTTTPWTLPGNVSLAINKDFTYLLIDTGTKKIIILKSSLEKITNFKKEGEEFSIIKEIKGEELAGLSYQPVFDYYQDLKTDKTWRIYSGDFVTDTDGTGVVHIAPAFGDDDMKLAQKEGLPVIKHVTLHGDFTSEVKDFSGQVKPKDDHSKADIEVIKYLAHNGHLFAKEKYTHSYPHCWRCKTPLLNYATSSWFIKTTAVKDRMIEINNTINWYPDEIGHKRLHSWLENNRDWAVSRSRYWGTPLPVWKSSNEESKNKYICLGSVDEIKSKTRRNIYTTMRHGEATHLIESVMSSGLEFSSRHHLTPKGREDVKASVEKMISENNIPDIIYSSPIVRTQESAEIVKQIIKEKTGKDIEIKTDARLIEQQYGDLDGQGDDTYNTFMANSSDKFIKSFPNGESLADVKKRVAEFLYEVDKDNENKNILIVTHEGCVYNAQHVAAGDNLENIVQGKKICVKTKPAQYVKIDFAFIPHNDEYELDFHRPYIDEVVFMENGESYTRLHEVLDVWYDAGSMPFSSVHYPFDFNESEQKDFVKNLTVDFVAESLDQTRGWFYYMLFMAVSLFDKAPFKNVIVGGMVLAEDGKKMSKSLGNFPDLMPVVEEFSADSLRYFLLSSPVTRAEEYAFSQKMLNEINNKFFNKILNTISFLEMHGVKNLDLDTEKDFTNTNELDAWIEIKLNTLIKDVTENLDCYQIDRAAKPILDFVEELSTWYLRRCRDRFKESEAGLVTKNLLIVLINLSKVIAPFTPFMAEEIYLFVKDFAKLKDIKESVHLENWPEVKDVENEKHILDMMWKTRNIVEEGLALRNKTGIKVRQPLNSIFIHKDFIVHENIIKDELNLKSILKRDSFVIELDTNITEDLRVEGLVRDCIRQIQALRKNSNLKPSDKISLNLTTKEDIQKYIDLIISTVNANPNKLNIIKEDSKSINGVSEIGVSIGIDLLPINSL
jgi:isoleucyl-tRNA synthetase